MKRLKFVLLILCLLGVAVFCFFIFADNDVTVVTKQADVVVSSSPVLDNSLEIEFKKAVLGKATAETNLIVMEQEISVESTLQETGAFNFGIFNKNKEITYVGTAIYSINLKYLDENDIIADPEKKTVSIRIPRPELYDLVMDPNDFVLSDTSKGLLAFGDIKITIEDAFHIERAVFQQLKEAATDRKVMNKATEIAEKQVSDFFETVIHSVDPGYKVQISFYG